MAVGNPPLLLGLDPLIAEAKRRTRRRRVLALALAVAIGGGALGLILGFRGPSSSPHSQGPAKLPGDHIASTPFAIVGFLSSPNGFMGDLTPPRREATLGCLDHRHYPEAFGIQNGSHAPVTLLDAHWSNPAPGIIERTAVQFLLSPPYHPSPGLVTVNSGTLGPVVVRRNWSGAPTRLLTVPPGRVATVQTNFLFDHCGQLARGRSVAVPGSLVLRYRVSGRVRHKVIPLASEAFMLVAGPTRRTCAVPGAISSISSDTLCAATRRAALACYPLSHGSWGDCTSAGVAWTCGRYAHHRETCWQAPQMLRAHWFRVRWKSRG